MNRIKVSNISKNYFGDNYQEEEYFRLSDTFLQLYANRHPNFGFNGLGEFVFYRTYSRRIGPGKKETFLLSLKRVVEGCYEIQRRHCRRLHIPWDLHKAQDSAQEMFDRMWQFKFLPPGRGLWMMGTPFMFERGSAALNNCFAGETEIITRDGIKPIGSLAGTVQTLLTTGGKWVDAPIHNFGKQELYKLTMERSGVEKVIYTTADHRWFARDRRYREIDTRRIVEQGNACLGMSDQQVVVRARTSAFQEFKTTELRPGVHCLRYVFGQGISGNVRPSSFGIAHGIAFGDGTTGQNAESCGTYLYLCGQKNEELLQYFPNCPATPDLNKGNEGAIRVADLPRFFRRPPNLRESKSYLYGWLAGYFAADGKINTKGNSPKLSSSKRENLEVARDVCAVLGIGTYSITGGWHKVRHLDGRVTRHYGYDMVLMTSHLIPEFFLLEEHRRRFESWLSHRERPIYHWRIKSVEPTGETAEVFCPQVPEYHAFALADNILTGNCGFVSTYDQIESDPAEPFCFLMDMSMLGVGVGFDTKGANRISVNKPDSKHVKYTIADSREGWVDSVRNLIWSYTIRPEIGCLEFDYSDIRPAGTPIRGFGGKASGPSILMELHDLLRDHLERKVNETLGSVDIVDLMNYIGRCVVAGNVRRCLPKGTLVHLQRGLVPIEQVQVGDLVLTTDGYHQVGENVRQGVQRVVTIRTQIGPFRCTDRHRVAVLTGIGAYEWKRAFQLKSGDRMIFVDQVLPGTNTVLPGYSDNSSRSKAITIPGLNTDVAWFLGAVQGDGYVYPGRRYHNRKHHGAAVTIPVNRDEYHDLITEKINEGFAAFGFASPGEQPSDDNCRKIRVISKHLAHYLFTHVKQAKTPLCVPESIRLGKPAIRGAYLAGLLDTDGSTKNRPTTLATSVYADFLRQVQAVYSSLGIPTKLRLRKEADDAGQAKWEIALVGDFAIQKFVELVQPYAVKRLRATAHASGHDFGFPSDWVDRSIVDYGRSWSPQQDQMTYHRAVLCEAQTLGLVPIEVYEVVDECIETETYDLSVPDRNEFVAQGLLVHNTAEIAFGEADDFDYCSMKNPLNYLQNGEKEQFSSVAAAIYGQGRSNGTTLDFADTNIAMERLLPALRTWNALNHHRWASNNSVFARVGMDYSKISEQIAVNGEPGLMWLDNMRDYGRMIDGRQPGIDGRVMGGNPCLEQSLESYELCNLVETFPANHDSADDYMRTLKFAYLYAKTVTLLPTHHARTNAVTLRNRRIGLSQSGIVQAFSKFGRRTVLQDFCDAGYNEIRRWDNIYAEWLCVQPSIKVTSVKPSGTVSLVAGATPGIHYPEASTYWRRVRVAKDSALAKILAAAGYHIEPMLSDEDRTVVIKFAISDERVRPVSEISIWEQMQNVVDYQRYWADNQVSCTIKFKQSEVGEIYKVIECYEDQLKGISFLPLSEHGYAQAPYEACTPEEVQNYNDSVQTADYSSYVEEPTGSNYCDNDKCEITR